jgi:hypothetical protein
MRFDCTAIIHLREPATGDLDGVLGPVLRPVAGVGAVSFESTDGLVTVRFDRNETSLAELVRTLEDAGCSVSGVAQRATTRPSEN